MGSNEANIIELEKMRTKEGINQERQRQRVSLQLAINKWSELK